MGLMCPAYSLKSHFALGKERLTCLSSAPLALFWAQLWPAVSPPGDPDPAGRQHSVDGDQAPIEGQRITPWHRQAYSVGQLCTL